MQLQAEEEEEETAASDGRAPPANDTLQTHYFVSGPPVCVCLCLCVGVCVLVCVCVTDRATEVPCIQGAQLIHFLFDTHTHLV